MNPRVVVSLLTSGQEFQQMQAADAEAAGKRLGLQVEVIFAESNAIQQIHQLYTYIHAPAEQRPLAIVVEAVRAEGMERLARNAAKAGIGWIAQQQGLSYVPTLLKEGWRVPIGAVAVDEREIGRIQARQFQALLPQGGAVLLLQGPPDSSKTIERRGGLEDALKGSPVQLKGVVHGDWTEQSAKSAMTSWLRLKTSEATTIDLVGSQNDSMATGARKAIQELRKDWAKIPCTGCDGLPEGGRRLVDSGELVATIVKPTTTGRALELIAGTRSGRSVPPESLLQPRSYPALEKLSRSSEAPRPARV